MTQASHFPQPSVFPFEKWGWCPPLQGFIHREHVYPVSTLAGCWGLRKGLDPTLSLPWCGEGQRSNGVCMVGASLAQTRGLRLAFQVLGQKQMPNI